MGPLGAAVTTVAKDEDLLRNQTSGVKTGQNDFESSASKMRSAAVRDIAGYQALIKSIEPGAVVCLVGPTSSGKTTFSLALDEDLSQKGINLKIWSLDRYYKPTAAVPHTAQGKPDWDHPEALNWDWIIEDLNALLEGREVDLPSHNQRTGRSVRNAGTKKIAFSEGDVLCIDSIFALDKRILNALRGKKVIEAYLTVPEELRMLRRFRRRLIRGADRQKQLAVLKHTVIRWARIRVSEECFIEPQQQVPGVILIPNYTQDEIVTLRQETESLLEEVLAQLTRQKDQELVKNILRFLRQTPPTETSLPTASGIKMGPLGAAVTTVAKDEHLLRSQTSGIKGEPEVAGTAPVYLWDKYLAFMGKQVKESGVGDQEALARLYAEYRQNIKEKQDLLFTPLTQPLSPDAFAPALKKFNRQHQALPYPGYSVISWCYGGSSAYQGLAGLQADLKGALRNEGLEEILAFVEPQSFHLTIHDLVSGQRFMALDEQARQDLIMRINRAFKRIKQEGLLPVRAEVKGLGTFDRVVLIALVDIRNDDLKKIARIQKIISEETGIVLRLPYTGHVTLGYFTGRENEGLSVEAYQRLIEKLAAYRDRSFGPISIDHLELSYFPDINVFRFVEGISGEDPLRSQTSETKMQGPREIVIGLATRKYHCLATLVPCPGVKFVVINSIKGLQRNYLDFVITGASPWAKKYCSEAGINFGNSRELRKFTKNKGRTTEYLQAQNIPGVNFSEIRYLPVKDDYTQDAREISDYLIEESQQESASRGVVILPLGGSQGRGIRVYNAQNLPTADSLKEQSGYRKVKRPPEVLVVRKWIQSMPLNISGRARDWNVRVTLTMTDAGLAVSDIFTRVGEGILSRHFGAELLAFDKVLEKLSLDQHARQSLLQEVNRVSLAIGNSLVSKFPDGVYIVGLDFIIDSRSAIYFLEANSSPDLDVRESESNAWIIENTTRRYMQYIIETVKRRQRTPVLADGQIDVIQTQTSGIKMGPPGAAVTTVAKDEHLLRSQTSGIKMEDQTSILGGIEPNITSRLTKLQEVNPDLHAAITYLQYNNPAIWPLVTQLLESAEFEIRYAQGIQSGANISRN
ncbi:MAG: DUF1868 domain-containing protein, partial [Candidatus Omnitrophica bacterium]|nr:DUF1868 domain-containing protein [Candidatus Omnitrophota bacterium]